MLKLYNVSRALLEQRMSGNLVSIIDDDDAQGVLPTPMAKR